MLTMSDSIPFDHILFELQNFYNSSQETIKKEEIDIYEEIYKPLLETNHNKSSKKHISKTIIEAIDIAEGKAEQICRKYDLNFFMSISRRYPQSIFQDSNWKLTNQKIILKYASLDTRGTFKKLENYNKYGLLLFYTFDDLIEVHKVCYLSHLISKLYAYNRWVTKGGSLCKKNNNIISYADDGFEKAVKSYDERSLKEYIAVYSATPISTKSDDNNYWYYRLMTFGGEYPIYCPKLNMTLYQRNHFLKTSGLKYLETTLRTYECALNDLYSVGVDCIMQFLYGLTLNIVNTSPKFLVHDGNFIYPFDKEDTENYHKLSFYFALCNTGYLRFPKDRIIEAISNASYRGVSKKDAAKLAESFINGFTLNKDDISAIDIGDISKLPFIYKSGDAYYIDLLFLDSFICQVIQNCKNWYSTQHGDHFTLKVKKHIQSEVDDIIFLPQGSEIVKKSFVDLIMIKRGKAFCVECKAYEKSVKYLKGDIESFNNRNSKIKKAVEQAIRNCNKARKTGLNQDCDSIDWIVCTTSQEFLNPIDKYGMLTETIPKVCTLEELTSFLKTI